MITQNWIDKVTNNTGDDISVVGPSAPMPDYKERYVATMVARGVDVEFAEASFASSEPDFSVPPEDAAEEEMSCWTDDGD